MHWMLEGQWYSVDYDIFAAHLGFSEDDLQRDRIHTEQGSGVLARVGSSDVSHFN